MLDKSAITATFGPMPAYIGTTTEPAITDEFHEMRWGRRAKDGLFGLMSWPDTSLVYLKNHNALVGDTWNRHLRQFAEFAAPFVTGEVLEVGSGHGLLGTNVRNAGGEFSMWNVVEPNPLATNPLGTLVNGWFPKDLPKGMSIDVIVHSHVFEHQESPLEFADDCWKRLSDNGILIMSLPNMDAMAKNRDFNMLMFEHLTFLPRAEVMGIMRHVGFELVEESRFEDHSLFLTFRKGEQTNGKPYKSAVTKAMFEEVSNEFRRKLEIFVEQSNALIEQDIRPTFIFGAHIFAQYLLAYGLNQNGLTAVVDNNADKHGERLYGTNLGVIGPESLRNGEPIKVLIPVASYESEVRKQLEGIVPAGSTFLGTRGGLTHV